MSLGAYIARRVILSVVVILGVFIVVFFVAHAIPIDPVVANLGQKAMDNPEIVAAFREKWGLDKSVPEQFWTYLTRAVRADLGMSIRNRRPVVEDLLQYAPATLELALASITFSAVIGVLLGVLAALNRDGWIDQVARFISLVGVSIPVFWLGIIFLVIFYWKLQIAPGPGRIDNWMTTPEPITGLYLVDSLLRRDLGLFWMTLKHLVLPSITLGSQSLGMVTRVTRASMLEVLGQDYIRTARAKGLYERVVIVRHALRNALIPTITLLGLTFGMMLSGAVITETIFSWPGLGRYAFQSATTGDFPAIMGVTLLLALGYIMVNLAVDVCYAFVNPQIRYG
jgi:peptide/nickel transport system permease protein